MVRQTKLITFLPYFISSGHRAEIDISENVAQPNDIHVEYINRYFGTLRKVPGVLICNRLKTCFLDKINCLAAIHLCIWKKAIGPNYSDCIYVGVFTFPDIIGKAKNHYNLFNGYFQAFD